MEMRKRLVYTFLFLMLMLIALGGRLGKLQMYDAHKLASWGLQQRMLTVPVELARGDILDRSLQPLTNTALHHSVVVFPTQIQDKQRSATQLSGFIGLSKEHLLKAMQEDTPHKLLADVDYPTAQRINAMQLSGVQAIPERLRYPPGALAAHVIGYTNASDNKGMSGIEAAFDNMLRDESSNLAAVMVDATHKVIPGLGYKRVTLEQGMRSQHVVLTIDAKLQRIVERVVDRSVHKGAVVLMHANGDVLAMASRPNFDASRLGQYLHNQNAPLLNRAIANYQPGSVFKLAVAIAALEEGIVKPQDVFLDNGFIDIDGTRFRSWDYEHGSRGLITFGEALAFSSNPIFIEVGLKLGSEKLLGYAKKLGLGQKTNIGLEDEMAGNLPLGEEIHRADLANISIGQGLLEATPLQMACLVASVINQGMSVKPRLVQKIISPEGEALRSFPSKTGSKVFSTETAKRMRSMMEEVTKSGTGRAAYVEPQGCGGKTGSAETGRFNQSGKGISHAWFVGYFPSREPEYVLVVMVEEGMSGGDIAAPIFKEIAEEMLKGK